MHTSRDCRLPKRMFSLIIYSEILVKQWGLKLVQQVKTSLGGTRCLVLEPHSHGRGGGLSSFMQYYKYKLVQQFYTAIHSIEQCMTLSFRAYISTINNPYQLNFCVPWCNYNFPSTYFNKIDAEQRTCRMMSVWGKLDLKAGPNIPAIVKSKDLERSGFAVSGRCGQR